MLARDGTCVFLILLLAGTNNTNGRPFLCPQNCKCSGLSAQCRGDNTTYVEVIRNLPATIVSFTFTIAPQDIDQRVDIDLDTAGNLTRLVNLQTFGIQIKSLKFQFVCSIGLGNNVFCGLPHLTHLQINVRTWHVNASSIQCLDKLEVLDLSYTVRLGSRDIRRLLAAPLSRQIHTLLLRNIQSFTGDEIAEWDFAELLTGLNRPELEVIDLAYNAITSMSPGLLLMPRLKRLDLSGNLLFVLSATNLASKVTWGEAVFHPCLRELIATDQGLSPAKPRPQDTLKTRHGVPVMSVSPVFHVRKAKQPWHMRQFNEDVLKLRYSILTSASHFANRNTSVSVFDIVANLLGEGTVVRHASECLYGITFPLGQHIQHVNLSGFQGEGRPFLNPVPEGTLCINPHNSLQTIDASNIHMNQLLNISKVKYFRITGLQHLVLISAKNNRLKLTDLNFFNSSFPSLRTLLLGGNRVQIPRDNETHLFKPLRNLITLDLSQNGLSVVPYLAFIHLTKLKFLDLSGNDIKDLSIQLPTSLQQLDISNNKLTSLRPSMTHQMDTSNLEVNMLENGFICGCETLDFIRWVQITPVRFIGKENLLCFTDTGRISLIKVDCGKLREACHPRSVLQVCLIAVLSTICFFCVLVSMCCLYRWRWRLRHLLYIYCHRRERRGELLQGDFEYDAFISYSEDSLQVRQWVQAELGPELERQRGLNLFIHQRDLLGGGFLLERIDEAMRKCRKTVLVLSPEFLRSRRCLYEAWSAHTSMVTEDRDAVVLVKLQALPVAGITGTLSSLMEIRECLTWTEDPAGQALLWDRLETALHATVDPLVT